MSNTIIPLGTATGPNWQYRLERAGQFTAWRNWSADPQVLEFSADPDAGALRIDTTYWLYARNALLPLGTPGSVGSELAASLQITASGRVVPVNDLGVVSDGSPAESNGTLDSVSTRNPVTANVLTAGGYQMPDTTAESLFDGYTGWIRAAGKLRMAHVTVRVFTLNWASALGAVQELRDAVKANLQYKLSELSEFVSTQAITLRGTVSFVTRRVLGGTLVDQGWQHQEEDGNGNVTVKAYLYHTPDNRVTLALGNGQAQIEIVPGGVQINTPFLNAGEADVLARTGAYSVAPLAQKALTSVCVLEVDDASGLYRLRIATAEQLTNLVLPGLQPILSQIQAGGSRKIGVVKQICTYTRNVPADTARTYTVTTAMVGVQQTHNLQVMPEQIFPTLLNKDNQPDTEMKLTLTDNQHWQIDYPEGGSTSGYEGGKLRLEKIDN